MDRSGWFGGYKTNNSSLSSLQYVIYCPARVEKLMARLDLSSPHQLYIVISKQWGTGTPHQMFFCCYKLCYCYSVIKTRKDMALLLSILISSLVRAALSNCQVSWADCAGKVKVMSQDDPDYSGLCSHYAGQELCQTYSSFLSVLCPASCSLCPRCDCEVFAIDLPARLL